MAESILAAGERKTELRRQAVHSLQAFTCFSLIIALIAPSGLATVATVIALFVSIFIFTVGVIYGRRAVQELLDQTELFEEAKRGSQQVGELFAMTDMLQAAEGHDDAGAVLMATTQRLLPEFGGALYVFNNSRDRLDLAASWNTSEAFEPAETLLPNSCWSLKRGKPHINDAVSRTLCCMHQLGTAATLEVPMSARGQIHGLLILAIEDEDAFARLMRVRRLGRALADSLSLALANITLRETLRTQSLRDPLTGLYNRRYMEDALERYISLAERSDAPTSVVMIDLDNFKTLNDNHGHAKGDAVLRDVASQLVGALRPSDVVSRYGGEEIVVILPNCSLKDAEAKAEVLRARIESLSEAHDAAISASLGVATVPGTATSPLDIIPMADAALYAAKQAGKNRVCCAKRTTEEHKENEDELPRLAIG